MPRSASVPSYRHHKPSGQAVVTIRTATGERRDVYLGAFSSPESRAEYGRIIAELATAPVPNAVQPARARLTVDQILLAFWGYAEQHYRNQVGNPTHEVNEIKRSLAPLRKLYGHSRADQFGPRALAAVRQEMIGCGWCRTLINRRMERIKRAFKWASSQELVPVTIYQGLRTLTGLQKGRTEARESEPVKPVDPAHVAATLPHLDAHLRTMVELQRLTGMRPGEVCSITLGEVERTGEVWLYRPREHKTAHRGRARVIPIGPKARAAIVAFLLRDSNPPDGFTHVEPNNPDHRNARLVMADAYQDAGRDRDAELLRSAKVLELVSGCVIDPSAPLFSPAEAREERFRAMRAARKSKVPPSQQNRTRQPNPKRKPGSVFAVNAYGHAVARAAEKAGVPSWHPNQLRHTFATEARKALGLEAAQAALGHSRADVTQVYAERDLALAAKVAIELG